MTRENRVFNIKKGLLYIASSTYFILFLTIDHPEFKGLRRRDARQGVFDEQTHIAFVRVCLVLFSYFRS